MWPRAAVNVIIDVQNDKIQNTTVCFSEKKFKLMLCLLLSKHDLAFRTQILVVYSKI